MYISWGKAGVSCISMQAVGPGGLVCDVMLLNQLLEEEEPTAVLEKHKET